METTIRQDENALKNSPTRKAAPYAFHHANSWLGIVVKALPKPLQEIKSDAPGQIDALAKGEDQLRPCH